MHLQPKKPAEKMPEEFGGQIDQKPERRPMKIIYFVGKIIFIFIFLGFIAFGFFSYKVISAPEDSSGFFSQIKHLIASKDKMILGESEDRINVLILGIGGSGHEGPYLTDTIILASIQPSTNKVAMMSIPRDLLAPIENFGQRKINHAYALAEVYKSGTGGITASKAVSDIFAVPVHYYARIDFAGFIKIIDDLGGVYVDVENVLDDEYFPVPGKETATTSERYEHLFIKSGRQHMDGELALKYVRSRKAKGIEGSDFARSKRQHNLIMAVKEKLLSFQTLISPTKINNIYRTLNQHLDTNIEVWELLRLYDIVKDVKTENISTHVLDDSPMGQLTAVDINGAYLLIPKNNDYSNLQYVAGAIFETQPTGPVEIKDSESTKTAAEISPKKISVIEIHNGTKINGLAGRVSEFLNNQGYSVNNVDNAPIQTYKKTLIYDISRDRNQETINELKKIFDAIIFESGPPTDLTDDQGNQISYPLEQKTDVLIILGQDAGGRY